MTDCYLSLGKRQGGKTLEMVLSMKDNLERGDHIIMMAIKEDKRRAGHIAGMIKRELDITVTFEALYRKYPAFPFKLRYDSFSEIIGQEPVEVKDVFYGYKFTPIETKEQK